MAFPPTPSNANNLNRMKNLMGAFYGVSRTSMEEGEGSARAAEQNVSNLDSVHFNVDVYMKEKLRSSPYTRLLDEEESIKLGIVQLDESMQQLVYDNYSKFIGATDTMQNMKEKLVKMESQVSGLESKMDAISASTKRMCERNAAKRNQLARLDRLASVVGNLSALFELPQKLRLETKVEDVQALVHTFKSAEPFLRRRQDVPSFAKITSSCTEACREIYDRVRAQSTQGLTTSQFNATMGILLDLGNNNSTEERDALAKQYFDWHQEHIVRNGVSKEEMVTCTFEAGMQRTKLTILDPLRQALLTGQAYFPANEELSRKLAREVVRVAMDRVRARFDMEPCTFASDDARQESNDGVIQALQFAMQEFVLFEQSLALPNMKIGDRTQELAERVLRRQVDLTMSELKSRAERAVKRLDRADVESSRRMMDEVLESIVSDVEACHAHLDRLMQRARAVVSDDIMSIFEDVLQANMQEWVVWLGETLCELEEASLLQALVARMLSTRVGEFKVQDAKLASKSLKNAGEQVLKAFCSFKGRSMAKALMPIADAPHSGATSNNARPTRISEGAVRLLNSVIELSPMLRQVGIPVKAKAVSTMSAVASRLQQQQQQQQQPEAALSAGMQRLFSEKLVVFDFVEFDGPSIYAAILRVALKTWFEYIREDQLSQMAYHQIQADVAFLRKFVGALTGEHAQSVVKLLGEVVSSAKERCVDPTALEPFLIDSMFTDRRDEVLLKMLD